MGVEIAQQGDLGPVVDHLAVDVGDEIGQRRRGERAFGGPAGPGQALLAEPAPPPVTTIAWAGPFVMNTKAEVLAAFEDYQKGKLGVVPATYVPHSGARG